MRKLIGLFALLALLGAQTVFAQGREVTGTVVDRGDRQPMPGVSVVVKGSPATGVATDINGRFAIKVSDSDILVFSFVGMKTQEVSVAGKNHIEVDMESSSEKLDEVVVVAYGTASRQSLTGSVSSVDSKTIEKTISTSVTGALEGSAPGVQVNNTYGEPGSSPSIRIRGFSSINGSNSPLYVVDGVPFNGNITDLNSNDIESLSVLKDASSAALYGNRAANGVVLITTKKGKGGDKPTVTFTTSHGAYTRGIKEYKRLGADEWMEAQWTGLKNQRMSGETHESESVASDYASKHLIGDLVKRNIYDAADDKLFDAGGKLIAKKLPGYNDLDWADALERTGYRQEYGLSYASSSDKYNVYASLGYLKEDGYVINTAFERYSARANSAFTPVKWFKGGLNVAVTSQKQNYNSSATGIYYANPFYNARYMAPVYPVYDHNPDGSIILDENGNKVYDTKSSYLSNRHIVFERLADQEKQDRLTADATAYVTFVLPYGFEATVKGTKNWSSIGYNKYDNPEIGDGAANNGRFTSKDYHYTTTNFQQQINWAQQYGLHHVDVLLGHESYRYDNSYTSGMQTDMSVEGNIVLGNFTKPNYFQGYKDRDALESYLARARYNYDEKYFFEASFRRDGTSRFHEDNRWGNFFSVGGAWDINKEMFMQSVDWVDYLKLRASYGEVGNNYNDWYAYQALYAIEKNGGKGALLKQSLSADDIKWETTQTIDVALEGRIFDRLNVEVGYFNKKSKDLLFAVPLPLSAGSYMWGDNTNMTQLKNIGTVVNRGWELSADVDIIKSGDWRWNFGMDATIMTNKVKTLPDGEDIPNGIRRYSEGHSIYEFYTYQFVGVDQMTGNSLYQLDPDKAATAQAKKKLVGINGTDYTTDYTYALKDWCGSALPDVYGSIHTNASWKGLALNVLMTYSLGGKIYDSSYASLMGTSAASASAQHKDLLKSWNGVPTGMTEASPDRIRKNGIPVIDHNLSSFNNCTSNRWLTNASYFVMKNITLSYELPADWMHAIGVQSFVINAGVENAFTLTKRRGMNPQYSFTGSQDDTYTTARIFNIGATLKF